MHPRCAAPSGACARDGRARTAARADAGTHARDDDQRRANAARSRARHPRRRRCPGVWRARARAPARHRRRRRVAIRRGAGGHAAGARDGAHRSRVPRGRVHRAARGGSEAMKSLFVCLVSFVVSGVAARPVTAQEPIRITLEEAQTRAQKTSHRLAELQAREAAAGALADVRASADRPNVALQAGYTRTNHVTEFVVPGPGGAPPRVLYPDVPDNWRTRIDLQWPIYTAGPTDALERAARAEASAVAADVSAARADLKLEVARAFWALVTARSSVGVLERAVERADAHVSDVRERLRAGLVPPNEVASAEAQA